MLIVKSTKGIKVKTAPSYRGTKCKDCIKGKRPIEECKLKQNNECIEQARVHTILNPTGQRLYWVLKQLTNSGEKRVAIRDTDMAYLINTTTRTLFINSRILAAYGLIKTEMQSHAGKEIAFPRKCYTFVGVEDGDERVG